MKWPSKLWRARVPPCQKIKATLHSCPNAGQAGRLVLTGFVNDDMADDHARQHLYPLLRGSYGEEVPQIFFSFLFVGIFSPTSLPLLPKEGA